MNKSFLVIIIIGVLLFTIIPVSAQEITLKAVDPSPYYDSKPCTNGDYIVWRRAINQNDNEYIELREPSWIMVYNMRSGESWNITEKNKLMGNPNIYYHAESPEIHGNKIIYERQRSPNSYDTGLFMYNISSNETWEVPLRSTSHAHGHHHLIEGDWIAYTHKESNKRQAYLLNYEDGNYRTIIGKNEGYSVFGMVMWGNSVVITALNNSGGFEILTYNINSTVRSNIEIGGNYSKAIATTIYENQVGICIKEGSDNQTQWNAYIYNMDTGVLGVFKDNVYGLLIDESRIIYQVGDEIHIAEAGKETVIIRSIGRQYMGDVCDNAVVWMDNSNAEGDYGDARDDFDVFFRKEISQREVARQFISKNVIVIAIIIAVVFIGILSRRDGKEGMI